MWKIIYIVLLFISIISCKEEKPIGWIDNERLLNREAKDWLSLGGDHMMQHYSPLDQITKENVKDLGYVWEYDASTIIGNVPRGLEATPIVVDGIMYTSGAWGAVYAFDAKTGKQLWIYKPKVDASYGRRACCDAVNRGLAVWEGKVYVGTLDGYLVCLNVENGSVLWSKDTFTDRTKGYTITSPPQVASSIVEDNFNFETEIMDMKDRLLETTERMLERAKDNFLQIKRTVKAYSPSTILSKGYAIITINDQIIIDPKDIKLNSEIKAILKNEVIHSTVTQKSKNELDL